MAALPLRVRLMFWWTNIKVWWLNRVKPLSEEQKRRDMDDLLAGPQDDNPAE